MAALPDLRDYRSALIVKPSSLGDIVHTLPAVHAIKTAHPHLAIRWIANPEWLPLLDGSPDIAETLVFPRKELRGLGGLLRWRSLAAQLRSLPRESPEIVLDFQGLLRSAMICRARGSRPIVGLSDAREGARWFYDYSITVDPGAHAVDRYLELPRALGVCVEAPVFPLAEGAAVEVQASQQPFILVHPYSRGEGKSLDAPSLRALCENLAPYPVIVVGVHREPVTLIGSHITDLTNSTTLAQLIWLMRRARFVISVDSGPMHIAAAVNDFTLGIHTWSDPRQVGPHNPQAWVWKAGRIAHRGEFSPAECLQAQAVMVMDARAMAGFVKAALSGIASPG